LGDVRCKLSELQLVAYRRDRSKGSTGAGQSGVSTLPTYELRPNTQRSRRAPGLSTPLSRGLRLPRVDGIGPPGNA
jgi:hypothetical protein